MSLSITGSGGGLTRDEAQELFGWNKIVELPISGSWTASATAKVADFATALSGVDLSPYTELRLVGDLTYRFKSSANSTSNYAKLKLSSNYADEPFIYKGSTLGDSQDHDVVVRLLPFLIRTDRVTQDITIYQPKHNSSNYCSYSPISLSDLNVFVEVGKASNSTVLFSVSGTFYLEGRK